MSLPSSKPPLIMKRNGMAQHHNGPQSVVGRGERDMNGDAPLIIVTEHGAPP